MQTESVSKGNIFLIIVFVQKLSSFYIVSHLFSELLVVCYPLFYANDFAIPLRLSVNVSRMAV